MHVSNRLWWYTWGNSYFIQLTAVTAAILAVYLLQHCNILNLLTAVCGIIRRSKKTRHANRPNLGI